MKVKTIIALGVGILSVQTGVALAGSSAFKSDSDKISYTLGADMGTNFRKNDIAINPDMVAAGLKEALAGEKLKLTRQEMDETIVAFQKKMEQKHLNKIKELSVKNKNDGEAFLANNKDKAGVKSLGDGLQYKVIKAGKGPKPSATDTVTVDYEGRFVDGNVFDSSYKRGQAATFPLSQVIKGWQEALQHMPTGATWEIYVPPHLAYGEQGAGGVIGPNQTLIFKVNLLSIAGKPNKG